MHPQVGEEAERGSWANFYIEIKCCVSVVHGWKCGLESGGTKFHIVSSSQLCEISIMVPFMCYT